MALAGDILIKLAADFAEFASGMDEATKKLDEFGRKSQEHAKNVEGFIGQLKSVAGALAGAFALDKVKAYLDQVQEHGARIEQMAASYKLTTAEVQGLQAVAQQTGRSFDELAKIGQQNKDWLDQVSEAAKRAGLVMGEDVTRSLKEMSDRSDEASKRIEVLVAKLSTPVKLHLLEGIDGMLKQINDSLIVLGSNVGIIDKIAATANVIGLGLPGASEGRDATLQRSLDRTTQLLKERAEIEERLAVNQREGRGYAASKDKEAIDGLNRSLEAQAELRKRLMAEQPIATMPAITVPGLRPGGGGGASAADPIDAQIRRFDALRQAAENAGKTITEYSSSEIEVLQRQVHVQQTIDDITGKLTAKYLEQNQGRIAALRASVSAAEEERAKVEERLRYAQQAIEVERRLGDGTAAYTHMLAELNKERASGKLSQDAYNRALSEGSEATRAAALTARRYDDDLASLTAGVQQAAQQYARAHDLFTSGQQAFNGFVDALSAGFDTLSGKSKQSFGAIAANFGEMLAKMALQAALSPVFKMLGGWLGGTPMMGAGVPGASGWDQFLTSGGRQGGGPVFPGVAYTVGEGGPERFVPAVMGSVIPAGVRGGDAVANVSVSMDSGSTPSARQAADFARKIKAAVVDQIQNEQRPGGTLYTYGGSRA
jgi:lambda family phage tail tape measure protein